MKALEIKDFALYHFLSDNMVEARGVEPLSETISTRASPGAALILVIPLIRRPRAGY
jgi:hypothetical protein